VEPRQSQSVKYTMYANDSKIGKKVLTVKVKIGTAISKEFCFEKLG